MNLPWHERIGVRLGVAVAGVLLLLASVTNVLTHHAFERAARSVQETSATELANLARRSLLEITEREAQVIAATLDRSAAAGRSAAAYLGRSLEEAAGATPPVVLTRAESGHWVEADPSERTTLQVPSASATLPEAVRDAGLSRMLDDLFPGLAADMGDGVGIYYVNPDGAIRYHPPIDLNSMVGPDFDIRVQPSYLLGTPEANPERITRWTAPYLDDAGNGLLVTAVTPVYAAGAFRGVISVDVSLARLAARLAGLAPLEESFAFLVDEQGRLITASQRALSNLRSPAELLSFGSPLDAPALEGFVAEARAGRSGISTVEGSERSLAVAHAPVPGGTGWSLAIGVPRDTVSAQAELVAAGLAAEARRAQRWTAIATGIAFLLALAVLIVATRRWVARPVVDLAAATRRLGSGELGLASPLAPRGEFRVLGEAFERMSRALAHQRAEILGHRDDLERQVAERTRELGNLMAISADLTAAEDAASLVRSVLTRLGEAVPFGACGVWRVEGDELRRLAAVPSPDAPTTPDPGPAPGPAPAPALVPASALAEVHERLVGRSPVLLSILGSDNPLRSVVGPSVGSVLLAPYVSRERLAGFLAVADPTIDESHQVDLVAAVAQQLGIALENARLLLEARERSALEERQHLARELHDSVSQALFGVVLGLQTASKEIEAPGRLRESVDYASELADAALKEMRALIFELRPEALETEGLAGLVGRQAEMLRARHELEVQLDAVEPSLPLEAKAVLYRVAQEALHNVVKHARARHVRVSLAEHGGSVRLEVRDDGRGMPEAAPGAESFGLHSMRERMALLGGRLAVRSGAGTGTTLTAELPIAQASAVVDATA